jgi:YidC/Oxa1 family membrane protein insertase
LGNLGWAVVAVTMAIKVLLMPLIWPSLKSADKMRELQPKLKKLQEKYKDDKKKLAEAQMELYKQEGVNPMSGCLPQLLQIGVLLIFFSAFNLVTNFSMGKGDYQTINNNLLPSLRISSDFKFGLDFLGSNLGETPAKAFASKSWEMVLPLVLLLGSGISQYFSAKLMMPSSGKPMAGKPSSDSAKAVADKAVNPTEYTKQTPGKEDDMMAAMQTQSLYMMPLMTVIIGWNFSVGILLYWFVNSIFGLIQQVVVGKVVKSQKRE